MKTQFTEREQGWGIRISSNTGFVWFETSGKEGRIYKAMLAKRIVKEKDLNPLGKYAFVCPINI